MGDKERALGRQLCARNAHRHILYHVARERAEGMALQRQAEQGRDRRQRFEIERFQKIEARLAGAAARCHDDDVGFGRLVVGEGYPVAAIGHLLNPFGAVARVETDSCRLHTAQERCDDVLRRLRGRKDAFVRLHHERHAGSLEPRHRICVAELLEQALHQASPARVNGFCALDRAKGVRQVAPAAARDAHLGQRSRPAFVHVYFRRFGAARAAYFFSEAGCRKASCGASTDNGNFHNPRLLIQIPRN